MRIGSSSSSFHIRLQAYKLNGDTYHFQRKAEDIEKLHEELITGSEGIFHSAHEKIFVLKGRNNNDLNWLNQKIGELVKLALDQDTIGIKSKLKEIIPEYQPYQPQQHSRS